MTCGVICIKTFEQGRQEPLIIGIDRELGKPARDEPSVLVARSTSETFQKTCAQSLPKPAGYTANVVQEAKELFTVLNVVRAGLGVTNRIASFHSVIKTRKGFIAIIPQPMLYWRCLVQERRLFEAYK